jgi:PAS domain S-box-containing protein
VEGQATGVRQRFDSVPGSASAARRLVRDLLLDADRVDLLDAAELVVSELTTNALVHTATAVEVAATVDGNGLLIEVSDGSTNLPAERDYAALAGTGRGLALVHHMTEAWGVRASPSGKVVWARVTADRQLHGRGEDPLATELLVLDPYPAAPEPDSSDSGTARVVLRNMPLLMHFAWHQHAETLLRERLLVRLEGHEAAALAEHAVVSGAMALLHDQIPVPALPGGVQTLDDVAGLLTSLVEPRASLEQVLLRVPREDVSSFATLNRVLDSAIVMAEADQLLAPPLQPELRELRRWLCGQVTSQGAGGSPVPWSAPATPPAPVDLVQPDGWDHDRVERSTDAVVAVNDTGRIIAVNGPALALLGYRDAAELVGQRLLRLIPARFHQGHLAGFTLHLTHGRSPLIGTPVVVPVVRADASESMMELLIEVVVVAEGRRVFTATLRAAG